MIEVSHKCSDLASPPVIGSALSSVMTLGIDTQSLICPSCDSAHLVEENAGRYLCLDCHSLSQSDASGQRLSVEERLCPHCGVENRNEAGTCTACGQSLSPKCLKCNAHMAVWQATCPNCATDQATYREYLDAQERERQRQLAAQRAARQHRSPSRRRYRRGGWPGMWRIGWLIWPLVWAINALGRSLRSGVEAITNNGLPFGLTAQLPEQVVPLAIGACIFSVGVVVLLAAAIPSFFRSS